MDVNIGDRFVVNDEASWVGPEGRGVQRTRFEVEVDHVDAWNASWKITEVLSSEGAPATGARRHSEGMPGGFAVRFLPDLLEAGMYETVAAP